MVLPMSLDANKQLVRDFLDHYAYGRYQAALAMLAPRERQVLELRYGIGWSHGRSFESIGRELGFSRQRINQISSKALAKLRKSRHARPLRSFWDS